MPELWEEQVGEKPHRVTVFERRVGGPVSIRWTEQRKPRSRTLAFAVRDDRLRLRKGDQDRARTVAAGVSAALTRGEAPTVALVSPSREIDERVNESLDLAQALAKAFAVPHGMHQVRSPHRRDMKRVSKLLLDVLGPRWLIKDLKKSTAKRIWEAALRRARDEGGPPHGYGNARKAVSLLYGVAAWLHERDELLTQPVKAPSGWQRKLRRAWEDAFDTELPDARVLRHSPEEAIRLLQGREKADARVWTMIELGAELRAGQVLCCQRSDLDLSPRGEFGLGTLTVRGRKRKYGEVVHLTPEQRAWIDRCMADGGYLYELERAYVAGEIEDYYLWQKGKLSRGILPLARHLENPGAADPGSLIKLFRAFEKACGVTHVHGRSWYGLRRVLTDIAPSYTIDDRVLDRLSGHTDPTTRARIYQDRQREEHRGEAADVRRRMRRDLQAGTVPRPQRPRRDDQATLMAILNRVGIVLSPEQQRHLDDLLGIQPK